MPVAADPRSGPDSDATDLGGGASEWGALRQLLLGPEREEIHALRERVENPQVRAQVIADVLPEAVNLASGQNRKLASALLPAVEDAVQTSVRRNPRILVDSLYPVIGAAIRKSVSSALAAMVQTLNDTLERSLSVEGLKWRLEAYRTGRPLGEVVLSRTLVYRVEQVLLIHENTGLLLQHVLYAGVKARDAEVMSGMLSAIRDFVDDSLRLNKQDSLESMTAGDVSVWVEPGPRAVLAAAIRGRAPHEVRVLLQQTLEKIHADYDYELQHFSGDTAAFEAVRVDLENCLRREKVRHDRKTGAPRLRTVALLAVAAAALVFVGVNQWRWSRYLESLGAEPGLVVLDSDRGIWQFSLRGLRDPLAASPQEFLQPSGLSARQVAADWMAFQSTDPRLVTQRAQALLGPPASVQLEFESGQLRAVGTADHQWVVDARRLAAFVPGVQTYDDTALVDALRGTVDALSARISSETILFASGSAALSDDGERTAARVAGLLEQLVVDAQRLELMPSIEVRGSTDAVGEVMANAQLARQRAESLIEALSRNGRIRSFMKATAEQPTTAAVSGSTESPLDRRVSIHVRILPLADRR